MYPRKFEFENMCFLLGSIFAEPPVSFDRFQKQRGLYQMNRRKQFFECDYEFERDDERWKCKHKFLILKPISKFSDVFIALIYSM